MDVWRILKATEVATIAHRGQVRKFGGDPYITHPLRVAQTVHVFQSMLPKGANVEDVMIAALLHDALEDTTLSEDRIQMLFGDNVLRLVKEVTSIKSDMDKFAGKTEYLVDKMQHMSADALFLKMLDRLDNVTSLEKEFGFCQDPEFATFVKKTFDATRVILESVQFPASYQPLKQLIASKI